MIECRTSWGGGRWVSPQGFQKIFKGNYAQNFFRWEI